MHNVGETMQLMIQYYYCSKNLLLACFFLVPWLMELTFFLLDPLMKLL